MESAVAATEVLSPLSGRVVALADVALGGQGFEALAAEGDEVSAGAGIIGFDVVAVEAAGASPITPVVLLDERDATRLSIRDVTEITLGATLFTVDG